MTDPKDLTARLERADQLSLALASERLKRAEAELRAMHLERRLILEQLQRAYALAAGDSVDFESGVITRANGACAADDEEGAVPS